MRLENDPPPKGGFAFLFPYLKPYRRQICLLLAGLIAGSADTARLSRS
ncbi:MAG: hypothetical protein MZV63_08310 [Marinilabiliales bacterium]|nr:hypothetical protein [Marinilabiliales bacterium]